MLQSRQVGEMLPESGAASELAEELTELASDGPEKVHQAAAASHTAAVAAAEETAEGTAGRVAGMARTAVPEVELGIASGQTGFGALVDGDEEA